MNYHLDGHGLHGTLLASAAQKACRRRDWKLMLYCLGLLGRDGKWKYVVKKLCLYSVEDTNVFGAPHARQTLVKQMKESKTCWPREGKPPKLAFTTLMFEMIFDLCVAAKSRLCDHAICAAPQWLIDLESREGPQPRKIKPLQAKFISAVQNRDWKRSLALMCLHRILFPNNLRDLWQYCPQGMKYLHLICSSQNLWCEELLMVESLLLLHPGWVSVDQPLPAVDKAEAWAFWQRLMAAELNYSLRTWIDWAYWEEIVWDKHTFRGNGGDSVKSLAERHPNVPEEFLFPDGPPIEVQSKMAHFFDVGVYIPDPVLRDPFWKPAREFLIRMEEQGRGALDYVSEVLELGSYSRQCKRYMMTNEYLSKLKRRKVTPIPQKVISQKVIPQTTINHT